MILTNLARIKENKEYILNRGKKKKTKVDTLC
jgi:hypothetical protein